MTAELWPAWRGDVKQSNQTLHLVEVGAHYYVTSCGLTWDAKQQVVKGSRDANAWPGIPVCSRCARRARREAFKHRLEAKRLDAFAERELQASRWRPR